MNGHFASVDIIAPSFKQNMTNYERIKAFPFAQSPPLSRFLLSEMWDKIPIG
jgi:hypothetical protein